MIGPEVVEGKARPLYIYADRGERSRAAPAPDATGGARLRQPRRCRRVLKRGVRSATSSCTATSRSRSSIEAVAPQYRLQPHANSLERSRSSVREPAHAEAAPRTQPKGYRSMTQSKPRPAGRPGLDRHLPGAAAARHRRLPAHDRAALRRPREVDPRARGGDARPTSTSCSRPRRTRPTTIRRPTRSTRSARSPPCCSS